MTKISSLLTQSEQFLTQRNWWQFHNPKNDVINMLAETCELAECFIHHENVDDSIRVNMAQEMADLFFGTLIFIVGNKLSAAEIINSAVPNLHVEDGAVTFEDLKKIVLQHTENFGVHQLTTSRQIVLALIAEAGRLLDVFIWSTDQESFTRVSTKKAAILTHIAKILGLTVYLADNAGLDVVVEFQQKMQKNAEKYPVEQAAGEKYLAVKDAYRKR